MSAFTFYNYQFEKIEEPIEPNLFQDAPARIPASESFPKRQELFGQLLMDDYTALKEDKKEGRLFFIGKKDKTKTYRHKHLMKPTDDIIIMKVANRKTIIRETKDFTIEVEEDFPSCVVIIDNRPGIQRVAIEKKTRAFDSVRTVENILTATFSHYLKRWSLKFRLDQLHEPRIFWKTVHDEKRYPLGFRKVSFHLPHLNLERLTKVIDKYLTEVRRNYDSSLDWQVTANKGGKVNLDENNAHQYAIIEGMTEHIGGNGITLYPNGKNRKPVHVGKDSFLVIPLDDSVVERLIEDMKQPNAFGSPALDKIKILMKTKIDDAI